MSCKASNNTFGILFHIKNVPDYRQNLFSYEKFAFKKKASNEKLLEVLKKIYEIDIGKMLNSEFRGSYS